MRLCKLLLLIMITFPVFAQAPPVYKQDQQNAQGYWYSRIINNTDHRLYCWMGYAEFYVQARSAGRWYGYVDNWGCDHI